MLEHRIGWDDGYGTGLWLQVIGDVCYVQPYINFGDAARVATQQTEDWIVTAEELRELAAAALFAADLLDSSVCDDCAEGRS